MRMVLQGLVVANCDGGMKDRENMYASLSKMGCELVQYRAWIQVWWTDLGNQGRERWSFRCRIVVSEESGFLKPNLKIYSLISDTNC